MHHKWRIFGPNRKKCLPDGCQKRPAHRCKARKMFLLFYFVPVEKWPRALARRANMFGAAAIQNSVKRGFMTFKRRLFVSFSPLFHPQLVKKESFCNFWPVLSFFAYGKREKNILANRIVDQKFAIHGASSHTQGRSTSPSATA